MHTAKDVPYDYILTTNFVRYDIYDIRYFHSLIDGLDNKIHILFVQAFLNVGDSGCVLIHKRSIFNGLLFID